MALTDTHSQYGHSELPKIERSSDHWESENSCSSSRSESAFTPFSIFTDNLFKKSP